MKRSLSLGICLVLTIMTMLMPVGQNLNAQDLGGILGGRSMRPVTFQFRGVNDFRVEDGKYYVYTFCNEYEGSQCTSSGVATRFELPKASAVLLMVGWH